MWRKGAPQVSDPLANVIDYLMAPFPGNRPQSPQMVLQCLEEINLDGGETQLPTQLPTTGQTKIRGTSGVSGATKQTSINRLRPLEFWWLEQVRRKRFLDWKTEAAGGRCCFDAGYWRVSNLWFDALRSVSGKSGVAAC